jgi:hypothetical protein
MRIDRVSNFYLHWINRINLLKTGGQGPDKVVTGVASGHRGTMQGKIVAE